MPAGRPTDYTPELGRRIAEAYANHRKGLRSLCEENANFPDPRTIYKWRLKHLEFEQLIAQAQELRLKLMAEDIVDISMDDTLDPADKRIQVDTRKWLLSKLIPKTYGDKLDLTSDGAPLPTNSLVIDQRVQSILMAARARRQGETVALPPEALKLLD